MSAGLQVQNVLPESALSARYGRAAAFKPLLIRYVAVNALLLYVKMGK